MCVLHTRQPIQVIPWIYKSTSPYSFSSIMNFLLLRSLTYSLYLIFTWNFLVNHPFFDISLLQASLRQHLVFLFLVNSSPLQGADMISKACFMLSSRVILSFISAIFFLVCSSTLPQVALTSSLRESSSKISPNVNPSNSERLINVSRIAFFSAMGGAF